MNFYIPAGNHRGALGARLDREGGKSLSILRTPTRIDVDIAPMETASFHEVCCSVRLGTRPARTVIARQGSKQTANWGAVATTQSKAED